MHARDGGRKQHSQRDHLVEHCKTLSQTSLFTKEQMRIRNKQTKQSCTLLSLLQYRANRVLAVSSNAATAVSSGVNKRPCREGSSTVGSCNTTSNILIWTRVLLGSPKNLRINNNKPQASSCGEKCAAFHRGQRRSTRLLQQPNHNVQLRL